MLGTLGGKGAKALGYASVVSKAYTSQGAAQKSRFIVTEAGSGHSDRGEKEVQSVIEAWEFPGSVRTKVGIPLSYPKGWFPS